MLCNDLLIELHHCLILDGQQITYLLQEQTAEKTFFSYIFLTYQSGVVKLGGGSDLNNDSELWFMFFSILDFKQ
jgi:hypothetical protein